MTTDLAVRDLNEVLTLGKTLAASGYFSDAKDAAQAAVKVLAGSELGIGPVASMTGIYIVKGRVTMSANLMAAQIKRSGKYNYRVATMQNDMVSIVFYEGKDEIGTSSFSKADAEAAGLWNSSDPWRKTPRNMLFARAMSNGARWFCPDIFSGPVYTPDELEVSVEPAPLPPAPAADVVTGEVIVDEYEEEKKKLRALYIQARNLKIADLPTKNQVEASNLDQLRAISATLTEMIESAQAEQEA